MPTHHTKIRLDSTIVPYVEFNDAGLRDVLMFMQACSVQFGGDSNESREVEMFLPTDTAGTIEDRRIGCTAQNISLFDLIARVADLADLQYDVRTDLVVFWAKGTNQPDIPASGSGIVQLSPSDIPHVLNEEVMIHHLKENPPKGPLALVKRIDWDKRLIEELPAMVLERIVKTAKVPLDRLVPAANLRLPAENERDPRDPSGRTFRGVETMDTHKPVSVLYVSKIEKVNEGQFEVHYTCYSGPLAAHGGSYVAVKTEIGWLIRRGRAGWIS